MQQRAGKKVNCNLELIKRTVILVEKLPQAEIIMPLSAFTLKRLLSLLTIIVSGAVVHSWTVII